MLQCFVKNRWVTFFISPGNSTPEIGQKSPRKRLFVRFRWANKKRGTNSPSLFLFNLFCESTRLTTHIPKVGNVDNTIGFISKAKPNIVGNLV